MVTLVVSSTVEDDSVVTCFVVDAAVVGGNSVKWRNIVTELFPDDTLSCEWWVVKTKTKQQQQQKMLEIV